MPGPAARIPESLQRIRPRAWHRIPARISRPAAIPPVCSDPGGLQDLTRQDRRPAWRRIPTACSDPRPAREAAYSPFYPVGNRIENRAHFRPYYPVGRRVENGPGNSPILLRGRAGNRGISFHYIRYFPRGRGCRSANFSYTHAPRATAGSGQLKPCAGSREDPGGGAAQSPTYL